MAHDDYLDYVLLDLFSDNRDISAKRMFSGYGVYFQGIIFALILQDTLYFKVDDTNRAQYEKAGCKPFSYTTKKGKRILTSYWEVPEDVQSNKEELEKWMQQSVRVSLNAKAKK